RFDPRGQRAELLRPAVTRGDDLVVAALRLAKLPVELAEIALRGPEARLVVALELPEQEPLQEPVLRAELLRRGIVAEQGKLGREGGRRAELLLRGRRAERDDVLGALDRREPRLELDAPRRERRQIDPRDRVVEHRQPLPVRALARVEDVVERAQALAPRV